MHTLPLINHANLQWIWAFYVHPFFADLEWKIIYVGSAESENYDQTLDTVYVGPVPEGKHMFVFQVSVKALALYGINIFEVPFAF